MIQLSIQNYEDIFFTPIDKNSLPLAKINFVPGIEVFRSRNSFGEIIFQFGNFSNYKFWRTLITVEEDFTLHANTKLPWLGFRIMLQNHLRHNFGNNVIYILQGQVNYAELQEVNTSFFLKKGMTYECFDIYLDQEFLQTFNREELANQEFLNFKDVTDRISKRPAWAGIKTLEAIEDFIQNPGDIMLARKLISEIINSITKPLPEVTIHENKLEAIFKVKEYIKINFLSNAPVNIWASLANLNITYFKQYFKIVFGISPYHYLIHVRLKTVKTLLLNEPFLTYKEIASRSGFSTYNNLRRAFRNAENMSMEEWKTEMKNKNLY